MKDIVLIPAYCPDKQLITLVDRLAEAHFGIFIVDDGSGAEYLPIFDACREKAKILHLSKNLGKGGALKSGMTAILKNYPNCAYFVTADADGQHSCQDIQRVFKELHRGAEFVLTVRKFQENMPARSKFGNALSRYVYTVLNGHYFRDNQSGLRGFSIKQAEWLVRVDGNQYDYEMNMLYHADKQGIPITTIPIETIYIDNNKSSHFHPIRDTVRIYARLFHSARITFASWLIIEPMLLLVSIVFGYRFLHITIPSIGAAATLFHILMNKFVIFRNFRYRDTMRSVVYAVCRYIAYTLGSFFFAVYVPFIPLFFTFHFMVILLAPAEYLFHKLLYIGRYPDIYIKE